MVEVRYFKSTDGKKETIGAVRTGWDMLQCDPETKIAVCNWMADYEHAIEMFCDKVDIDPFDCNASDKDLDLKRSPLDVAKQKVRNTMKRLGMI